VEMEVGQTALIPAGRQIPVLPAAESLRFLVAAPGVARRPC
jgi:hypothetical protein